MYTTLKLIHQLAIVLSISGFAIRYFGMLRDALWLKGRLARTAPHVIDTILLVSAIALVMMLHVPVFRTPWLVAKIVGLVVYIALGTIALKRGRSRSVRAIAGVAAMTVFAYIVTVAVTKDPRGWLMWLGLTA
jgi:uncharacterized membrane protein SirB2